MLKLSIIIPIYNAEQYVERCLLSCLDQDIDARDYEIVAVNDGTPDNSMEIVRRIAAENENIVIVEQENGGPGAARNRGVAEAKGDYVWFVDSDDWIASDCLGGVVERLESGDLDGLIINATETDGQRYNYNRLIDCRGIDSRVYSSAKLAYKFGLYFYPPTTIYRRSILIDNDIKFMAGIYHEDNEFIPRAFCHLDRIAVWDEILYYIYVNNNSITRTINPKRSYDLLTASRSLAIFTNRVDKRYHRYIYKCIAQSLNTSLLCALSYTKEQQQEYTKVLHYNRRLFSYFVLSRRPTFMIEGVLFMFFPRHALAIYNAINKLIYKRKG